MNMLNEYAGKKVLVAGGAGFVGSNLTDALVKLGARVAVIDDLSTGSRSNIDQLAQVEFLERTITDAEAVRGQVSQADYIFHLAAKNIIVSTRNPRDDCQTNILGTLNLLLLARDCGKKVRRFVYSSSASIYGNPRHMPINEDDGINTLTPYSVSKLAGENYCSAFYESYGLPAVVVRYSNVYGRKQTPSNPYCGVVAKFFQSCSANEPLQLHGDGDQTRDFTYIADIVEATLLAGVCPKAVGGVYNVGTGIETSVNDLACRISALFGRAPQLAYVDRRDIDNIRRRVLNIEKIRRDLRWVPRYNMRTGLQETKEWFDSSR